MNRNEFLKNLSHGVVSLSFLPSLTFCKSGNGLNPNPGNSINESFNPDLDVELTAAQRDMQVLSGSVTSVFSYISNILKADNATVENLPGSWLGPVFRVKPGQKIRVRF